jgi:quercetin dioxygenase-like cupin family protein|tara:strand:- start:1526 stop:1984 length:459 start_codon:yes stop_codon:yes gene_type:complete
MDLTKIKSIDTLQRFIIDNNDKEGFYGDGKNIPTIDEIPITHKFADQIYIRQMDMKKDQVVVGCMHNHLHAWFLMTGSVTINDNGKIIEYVAPYYTISKPGARRIIRAIEDSIFISIHKNPSNTKNKKKLEKEIVSITKKKFMKYKQLNKKL